MQGNREEPVSIYELTTQLFCAAAIACVACALHKVATGVMLAGQLKAYDRLEAAYTPEEREVLIHKIKTRSLRY